MKNCILTWLITLLFFAESYGRDFRYLRTENGLTDGEINSIVQDSNGNMWFATWTGLIRHNGYSFKIYQPVLGDSSSLPEKKIKFLYTDSKDNLWIVSSLNVSRFKPDTESFQTYRFESFLPGNINVMFISEISNHLVFYAPEGLFFLPLDEAEKENVQIKSLQIFENGQQVIDYYQYLGAFKDVLVLVKNITDGPSQLFLSHLNKEKEPFLVIDTLLQLDEHVNHIEFSGLNDLLYIATTNGVISYNSQTRKFGTRTFKGQDIQQILYTSNQRLYCSLPHPEIVYLDLHSGLTGSYVSNPYIAGSLLDNEIHALFEDFSGNLWVGHQGQGISIMDLYQKKFWSFRREPHLKQTLNSNTIMCFEGTENEIFIGCRTNGLNIVSKAATTTQLPEFRNLHFAGDDVPGKMMDGIWDIEKQSDSLFWLGTDLGLYKLYRDRKYGWVTEKFQSEESLNFPIRTVFVDNFKNIWCGSHGYGLFFIPNPTKNKTGKFFSYENSIQDNKTLTDNVILSIFIDSGNRFWVGTNNGLNLLQNKYDNLDLSGFDQPRLRFKRFVATSPNTEFLNNNEINCFYENFNGDIWIATQGGGINIYHPNSESFSQITTEDGLPSNNIISMLPDEDGNLWISTHKGLVCYNRFAENPKFQVFNSADGIQGEIFMVNSFYKASDGQMFFGGDNGFSCFYPREIEPNTIKPRIFLNELRIRNQTVELGDTIFRKEIWKKTVNEASRIAVPYKNNSISIGVSALHFQNPAKNQITYYLEGLFNSWYTVPASAEFVYLSNIPPGSYTFRAKTISADGLVSENEKTMEIFVAPPWFLTRLAIFLFGLFGLALTFGFIFILVNRQKLIYQKEIDKMTIENNESKMLFLTNIAHELRTPLSLIVAPVEDIVRNLKVDGQWKNHMQLISRNSNYLLRLINQIIDFRKLHAGKLTLQPKKANIVRVVKDVVLNFKGYESNRNIQLKLNVPAEAVNVIIDVQKIEEVLYNLISNAFRHTFNDHSITVSLEVTDDTIDEKNAGTILITVFNEGKEIKEEDRERIFERFYKVDENSEGAGIGLSFAKSLVEMHNGQITVESVSGQGVSFYVKLPFNRADDSELDQGMQLNNQDKDHIVQPVTKGNIIEWENGAPKILIAEDNAELREFLLTVLSRNYHCLFAENGSDGWQMIKKHQPALVISDIIMPGMSGLELCRKIKTTNETCHIPVILLTAKDTPEQISEGFNFGADAYVTKPFDVNLLMIQTNRLIQNRELIKEKYKAQNFMVEVEDNISSRDEEFIQSVKEILEENISDADFNVNKLAGQLNISTTQLYRRIKELTGYSPVELIRIIKLQKAYTLLSKKNNTIKEVCYLTGFNNLSYFIKCFREHFGITPANFRDNGLIEKPEIVEENV
ncbi:MAG: two-component regulator propeller domain-containing protein [Mariniphaga sp.]|jgi:signal transduction histidine kinase/ligand-binding sensor domain-containing protein/CheY-like chemotaxis protein|nr:two-component regulator propeller domain-containing protein [Mariniphaga sp.]